MRILDALIKAFRIRSFKASSNGNQGIRVVVHGEVIEFVLTEEVNRKVCDLAEEEERERDSLRWIYRDPPHLYVPSGTFSLEITTYCREEIRCLWRDGKRKKIENILNSFVVSLLKTADALRKERLRCEEERRCHEEWKRQRTEKLRLICEEEKRLNQLNTEVNSWHASKRMRAYIHAVRAAVTTEHGLINENSECAAWLEWATQQADRLDPLVKSPASILDEKSQWE